MRAGVEEMLEEQEEERGREVDLEHFLDGGGDVGQLREAADS